MPEIPPHAQPTLPAGTPSPTGPTLSPGPVPAGTQSPTGPTVTPGSGPASPVPSEVGRTFGPYRILAELGHGGMGIVWKAWDTRLQRVVALKRILDGDPSSGRVQRFVREAQAAARLRHPNIVGVYDVGIENGQHYFTSDFIDGRSLEQMLDGEIPLRTALELVRSVAEALAYAHEQGIIHRDVKPANILVDATGRPFVMDFGLAREVDQEAGSGLTLTGDLLGTPLYMSPEQAGGHAHLHGPASDQFSLGVVLYLLVTGHLPFQAETLQAILNAITDSDPIRPRVHRPDLPRDVETICLKALEKDPKRRYASMGEMARDLRRVLDGDPIQARGVSLVGKLVRRARKNRAVLVPTAIAVVALAVLPFLWTFLTREREERARSDEALQKASRVQEVFSRWGMLSRTLGKLEESCYDSRKGPEERRAAGDALWGDVEQFIRATPPDATSQATMKALAGWARKLAGREEEGIAWMRESRRLDPDLPYGALIEGLDCLSTYFLLIRGSALTIGAPSVEVFVAPEETPELKSLRARMEALLEEASSARVWGREVEQDARNTVTAVRAFGAKRYEEADQALSAVIGRASMQVFERDLLLARACMRLILKRYEGGVEDVERVREARPDQAFAFLLLGLLHGSEANDLSVQPGKQVAAFAALSRALGDFDEAVARDPRLVAARLYRGMAAWALGEGQGQARLDPRAAYGKAILDYTEALSLEPSREGAVRNSRALAYLSRARATVRRGGDAEKDFGAAVADLDAVAGLSPAQAATYNSRGVVRLERAVALEGRKQDPLGAYAEAIEDFGRCLERDARSVDALRNRGLALARLAAAEGRLGRDPKASWERSLADLSALIAEASGKWEDRLNRGVVLHQLGRYTEAIADYEAARELSGGKADVGALLEDATRRSGAQPPR